MWRGQSLVFVNVSTSGGAVTAAVRDLMRLEAKERGADSGNIQLSVHLLPKPWLMLLAFQTELNLILVGRCRTDTDCSFTQRGCRKSLDRIVCVQLHNYLRPETFIGGTLFKEVLTNTKNEKLIINLTPELMQSMMVFYGKTVLVCAAQTTKSV